MQVNRVSAERRCASRSDLQVWRPDLDPDGEDLATMRFFVVPDLNKHNLLSRLADPVSDAGARTRESSVASPGNFSTTRSRLATTNPRLCLATTIRRPRSSPPPTCRPTHDAAVMLVYALDSF